jgi:hypothetical protein
MKYPQETKEFQPISVTLDGVEVTDGVQVCVIAPGERPLSWTAPSVIDDGRLAVMIDGMAPGNWAVWAKVTTPYEAAVIYCGMFKITS